MAGKGIAKARQVAEAVKTDAGAVEVEIAAHLKPQVARLVTLIGHYEQMAGQMRGELRQLLHTGHGIDIAEPGWHVVPDAGMLVRQAADLRPASASAPVAAAQPVAPASEQDQ